MLVLSLDPGTHTGYTILTEDMSVVQMGTLHHETPEALYRSLDDLFTEFAALCNRRGEAGTVVIERFITVSAGVAASADGILTQKLCGFAEGAAVIRWLAVVWHTSSVRKAYEDDARRCLRAHTTRRLTPHEVSATAHGVAYLTRRRGAGVKAP